MSYTARAAITRAVNTPVVVETITVDGPKSDEVTIKLGACGVCHSDLSAVNGTLPFPPPVVLGHEGAGTVVEVGAGVTEFAVGDTVLSSFVSMCGQCRYCSTGRPALCDLSVNTAQVTPGSVCVVFGAGGVGLNAIQGCAMSGAAMVVAVDMNDAKLTIATAFGATHTLNPQGETDVVKALRKLTVGGADYAFECVGYGSLIAQAYGCLRKGGSAVMVGVAKPEDTASVRTNTLVFEEKTLTGSLYGGARPRHDFPRLLGLYKAGRLKLDELITRRYTIDEAPQAFDDLASGRNARGVIVFD